MKNTLLPSSAAALRSLIAAAAVALVFSLSGCASSAPRLAFNTVDSAVVAVQTGLSGFNACYQSGKCTDDQRARLKVLYERFQTAAESASHGVEAASEADVASRLAALSAAAEDLLRFVEEVRR